MTQLMLVASEMRRAYRTAREHGFTRASSRKLAQSYRDSLIRQYIRQTYPEIEALLLTSGSSHRMRYPEGGYTA